MSKRKLDELFQDTFSGHTEVPDERVWDSIAASLDKKKTKRILPLWWSLGGIAAAIALGLIIFNPFTDTDTAPIITNVEKTDSDLKTNEQESAKDLKLNNTNENDTKIADKDNAAPVLGGDDAQMVATESNKNPSSKEELKQETKGQNSVDKIKLKQNNAVAQNPNKIRKKADELDKEADTDQNNLQPSGTAIAQSKKTTQNIQNIDPLETELEQTKKTSVVANNENKSPEENGESTSEYNNIQETIRNKDGRTEVAETQTKNQDSTPSNTSNKKSIFDEINKLEDEIEVADNPSKKWSAGPSVAPVYFNAIGEGSSVHSIFVPNSKSGNVNMSYGLSVGYEINPKLKIRSGLHRVDFGYDTNEISFSSSPVATTNGQIDNIDYRLTARNLVVSSKPGGSALAEAPTNSLDVNAQNPERNGFMTQQLGYLEIPVELNYALINKKFGLNLIGGVSSLFLMDNSVALTSGDLTTEMGEANNLNSLNFSANFGLGVNYKFSQNIQLNLEPVFKYQLNTFSETAGSFNPYAVGVYSGLIFRF